MLDVQVSCASKSTRTGFFSVCQRYNGTSLSNIWCGAAVCSTNNLNIQNHTVNCSSIRL